MEAIHSLLPTDNVVIDDIDDEFYDAIKHFKKQDIIGLALEEPECDRYGDLQWLSISTSMCTFIFDIKKLQKNAFHAGLKTVLENPRIVKILHDCRRPSDCLFHQYDTKLNNVYDTQVADFVAIIQKVNTLNISKSVNNLYHCLASYLQIPEEFFVPKPKKSDYSLRPIKPYVKTFLIKNVVYLRLLKKELDVILRMPYRRCVDIFMQAILRKSDGEMKLCPPEIAVVPPELFIEGMQVFQITDQLPEWGASIQRKSENYDSRNDGSGNGNVEDNRFSTDFDRTEVIKFLMERMFYGRKSDCDTFTHYTESDQYSVKSTGIVSSLCDSVSPVKESKNIQDSLSTLSKLKSFSTTPNYQNDSKLLPFKDQNLSDTSSLKDRSEKSMAMSKTIDLVRRLKLKSVPQNIGKNSKRTEASSIVESEGNSLNYNFQSEEIKSQVKSSQSEVNNNVNKVSSVLKYLDEEDPISIITSKDISPSDIYKYIMSNRSKASSKKSTLSDSSGHISSDHSEKSCSYNSNSYENAPKEVMIKEGIIADHRKSSSTISELDNEQMDVGDLWEKLKSAFDCLGPQTPIKKSLFIPAGMNC